MLFIHQMEKRLKIISILDKKSEKTYQTGIIPENIQIGIIGDVKLE